MGAGDGSREGAERVEVPPGPRLNKRLEKISQFNAQN